MGLYHYLNTAKSNYREQLRGDVVRLKKYFYVLRPLLACKWIIGEGTPPPMLFETLMDKYLDESVREDVEALLRIKMSTSELGDGKRLDKLNEYLDRTVAEVERTIESLPTEDPKDWKTLNSVFLKLI